MTDRINRKMRPNYYVREGHCTPSHPVLTQEGKAQMTSQPMSVIVEFRVPSSSFELGRILSVDGLSTIELERLVPTSSKTVPLFWVYELSRDSFVEAIQTHPSVTSASAVDVFADRTLFTLDWDADEDVIFRSLTETDGQLLSATGTPESWTFEARFIDHNALSRFSNRCEAESVSLEISRVYNATAPDTGPWYGLTERQREALTLAMQMGYYDIPRGCSTKELATELGISDQAVTERLRRAIVALGSATLNPGDTAHTNR